MGSVEAVDPENNILSYSLTDANIEINPITGLLTVKQALGGGGGKINLDITVSDGTNQVTKDIQEMQVYLNPKP